MWNGPGMFSQTSEEAGTLIPGLLLGHGGSHTSSQSPAQRCRASTAWMATDCWDSSATGLPKTAAKQAGGSRLSTDFWVSLGLQGPLGSGGHQPCSLAVAEEPSAQIQGDVGTAARPAPLIPGSSFRLIPLLDNVPCPSLGNSWLPVQFHSASSQGQ